jgi:hypothetical protein
LSSSYRVLSESGRCVDRVDLRKRTRTEAWTKRARRKGLAVDDEAHEHCFGPEIQLEGEDVVRRKCEVCGMETEEIVF